MLSKATLKQDAWELPASINLPKCLGYRSHRRNIAISGEGTNDLWIESLTKQHFRLTHCHRPPKACNAWLYPSWSVIYRQLPMLHHSIDRLFLQDRFSFSVPTARRQLSSHLLVVVHRLGVRKRLMVYDCTSSSCCFVDCGWKDDFCFEGARAHIQNDSND